MRRKIGVPVASVVVAVGAVLGGIFVFAADEREPDSGQAAGPAPTTRLSLSAPDPSGMEPAPGNPYATVPFEQVDGNLAGMARTKGRNLYLPVQDNDCVRDQVWPRGESADRVTVEIRSRPGTPPTGMTGGSYGCLGSVDQDGPYAVIELAEPLGDRRLEVTYDYGA